MTTSSGLHKSIFKIALILLISITAMSEASFAQDSQQNDLVFSAIVNDESDISFLAGLSQLIIKDKTRLADLNREKDQLEPIFNKSAMQFHFVDSRLDSLRNIAKDDTAAAIIEQEWKKLEDGLEYMLKRQRSINQQIQILQQKIDTEREAFSLAMKGRSGMVMEITKKAIFIDDLNSLFSNSENAGDSLTGDRDVSVDNVDAEYNWKIVEAERKLQILKAEFEVARKVWLLIERLLTLNEDDYISAEA